MAFVWITELGKSCQSLSINLSNIRFAEMANKANILLGDENQQEKAAAVPTPVPRQNFPYIIHREGWIQKTAAPWSLTFESSAVLHATQSTQTLPVLTHTGFPGVSQISGI